ncbi:MAG: transglycosylase SLT domain-containing protein [SAR324 cluster bacterium]|nr:transglycosylase SLT domain-containing protein [SAR324 cluster bacterium]
MCLILMLAGASLQAQDRFSSFENRAQSDEQRFAALKQGVEERWGRYLESTVPRWVEYSKDLKAERQVEFEQGFVEIAVLQEPSDTSGKQTETRLKEELKTLLEFKPAKEIPPLLEGQLEIKGVELKPEIINQQWKQLQQDIKVEPVQPKPKQQDRFSYDQPKAPPVPAKKMVLRIPLAPNHVKRRAEKFLPLVQEYSREFDLDPALILGVMHTESSFNPNAKSSVAYGLMQLVPKSGAREAYKVRYGKDKIVSGEYLYNPRNNIELGTQYLRILTQSTFSKVNDQLKIQYMAISAYNTGPGNVSRALIGRVTLANAIPVANNMNPEELYNHLVRNLPYQETRDYLRKVTERMPLYQQ